ncbi:hypothetical protein CDL12_28943 [Handroanthus impetiginosus]|uniref:Ubiquitinyl hydrolase 1 n=1 Tax=Handroanthus impetiginosus TaxID=429701 RepID=A0A2G9FZT0_9LAMI|nr:hypothetical protein CDL12_28943 [Handroanthus impetiginosus]
MYDVENLLKNITAEMVFEFNPTSQELCLLNSDSAVAVIVRAKDQEIKELKKRVVELETAANKNLCVLTPIKADVTTTKEQRDRGAACEEQSDNDGEEKKRKDEEEEDEKDEEMDEERKDDKNKEEKEKVKEDEQKKKKTKEGQDNKKGEKKDGKDEEGKEKEDEKEEKRKYGDDDEERDHNANNEYNDMNKKNQTKHRANQLNFGQDVNFDERDYEAVRTLSFIVDDVQNQDELIEKRKSKDFDSPLSTTPVKCAKQRNEKRDHVEEKKTISEQEKAGPQQKKKL